MGKHKHLVKTLRANAEDFIRYRKHKQCPWCSRPVSSLTKEGISWECGTHAGNGSVVRTRSCYSLQERLMRERYAQWSAANLVY